MAKTVAEINNKIRQGKAVVFTAEEIIEVVKAKGVKRAAAEVDVEIGRASCRERV